ncbi:MAG TPA: hypothetical protein VL326_20470 [Kofleriaceae bacterium]|nr:hypothetical protein [Kofleriaceae bacterium]
MKRSLGLLVIAGCPLLLAGCPMYRTRHPPPLPMPAPTPIPGINSPYDDFNSADARLWYRGGFIFSSNRGSQGANFDLYETTLRWSFPESTPGQPTPVQADEPTPFAPELMSDADERGPIVLDDLTYRARLVFASNREGGSGGLDLYVAEQNWPHLNIEDAGKEGGPEAIALRPLTGLNTAADEAYLTAPIADHQMLFASNRTEAAPRTTPASPRATSATPSATSGSTPSATSGSTPSATSTSPSATSTSPAATSGSITAMGGARPNDIFLVTWDARDSLEAVPYDIRRADELSSPADDTAPSIYKNARGEVEVVFVSTRAGALGEHDLYCSRYVDTRSEEERERRGSSPTMHWTPPVHLKAFSSPRDEYRPIVMTINTTRFLIFSSTREGGQGGYDLYIVGYSGCPTGPR